MRKSVAFLPIAALLLLGAACQQNANIQNTTNQIVVNAQQNINVVTTNTNSATNTSNTNSSITTHTITVTSSGFSPSSLTIQKGDTVNWVNQSSSTAYIAPANHPTHRQYSGIWDDNGDGEIRKGATYSHTFNTAGTFEYHNHNRSSQTGTIIVQ